MLRTASGSRETIPCRNRLGTALPPVAVQPGFCQPRSRHLQGAHSRHGGRAPIDPCPYHERIAFLATLFLRTRDNIVHVDRRLSIDRSVAFHEGVLLLAWLRSRAIHPAIIPSHLSDAARSDAREERMTYSGSWAVHAQLCKARRQKNQSSLALLDSLKGCSPEVCAAGLLNDADPDSLAPPSSVGGRLRVQVARNFSQLRPCLSIFAAVFLANLAGDLS